MTDNMNKANNSEPCLSEHDQKRFEIAMVGAEHLPEDVRKVMVLTILQEKLKMEIEDAKEQYYNAKKQIDEQTEKLIKDALEKYPNDEPEKQTIDEAKKKLKDEASPLLDIFEERVNNLIVRSNAFTSVMKKEFKC